MAAENNLATIRGVDEAFGTGDVEAILTAVADDVDWAVDAEPVGPWYGQRRGRDGVASFFADIAGAARCSTSLSRPWVPAIMRFLILALCCSHEVHRTRGLLPSTPLFPLRPRRQDRVLPRL